MRPEWRCLFIKGKWLNSDINGFHRWNSHTLYNLQYQEETREAKQNIKTEITDHEKWFDNDYKNLTKSSGNVSNQKHREPDNNNMRLQYGETLKQYKHTLRTEKEQHIRNQMDGIEESIETNSGRIGIN